ncbi:hypothetical protein [Bacillus velezensis]|nr:hypothetical protein [Bacillus velezensis]
MGAKKAKEFDSYDQIFERLIKDNKENILTPHLCIKGGKFIQ